MFRTTSFPVSDDGTSRSPRGASDFAAGDRGTTARALRWRRVAPAAEFDKAQAMHRVVVNFLLFFKQVHVKQPLLSCATA